jgi:hypothetical protein
MTKALTDAARYWAWLKYNPHHVQSGPDGGQFTSGPDTGAGGASDEDPWADYTSGEGYTEEEGYPEATDEESERMMWESAQLALSDARKQEIVAKLRANVPVTDDPDKTQLVLPDGTRLWAGRYFDESGSHYALLQGKIKEDMHIALGANVLRYKLDSIDEAFGMSGVEVASSLTTAQAHLIVDDSIARGKSLTVDVSRLNGDNIASKTFDVVAGEGGAWGIQSWVEARLDDEARKHAGKAVDQATYHTWWKAAR